MNQDNVKDILLQIADTELEFSVTFTGKSSKKVNGLYKPDTHEIILHNKNFASDNEMIYTAIHEYTHHKQCEKEGGFYSTRVHTPKFWTLFHLLLEEAEKKGLYKITLEESPELIELTEQIRQTVMVEDGKLIKELGRLLAKARPLCKKAGVRYEDYVDRVLCLPRASATALEKINAYNINPEIGADAMRQVANIGNAERRAEAERLFLNKNSPAAVRGKIVSPKKEEDPRRALEKEKRRLEKTILSLQAKLESVESRLANMPVQAFIFILIFSSLLLIPLRAQDSNGTETPSIPPIPSIPQIPEITVIPVTGEPPQPIIPKAPERPVIKNPLTPKNTTSKGSAGGNKAGFSPSEYMKLLNGTQNGNFIQTLMNSVVGSDEEGSALLNKILNQFHSFDTAKNPVSKFTSNKDVRINGLKLNGVDVLKEIGNIEISRLTADKSFFAAADSKFLSDGSGSKEILYIFAKRNTEGKYKLFIEVFQNTENENSVFYKLAKLSPVEAELKGSVLFAELKTESTDFEAVFLLKTD
ncbi:hypothetical protein [Treponema pedis]|uniref:hypothetical protein n=1 Tax=Treponema pedis TaxID=409322 RepID=UPI00197D17D5|nr:hypothetical protein [Treponema pedis]QSI03651.1 hypothetical protein DYQ05_01320 [Treponema pedis]